MSSEKKERSFVIDAIILCVITLVLGGILAGVYTMTKGTIAQRQADTDSKACEKVIASVDGATVADAGDDAAQDDQQDAVADGIEREERLPGRRNGGQQRL